ncbi:hypothetical protein [Salana multivorans]|uniref:hypothetical protein n=1 Tax=Salana multivorans TaxID=120377 RepID=UPI001475B9FA|nr:hypothetical protein [Salana multivorans]
MTPYPPQRRIDVALSIIGSSQGRHLPTVLGEVEHVLRGATAEDITLTRLLDTEEEMP